MIQSSKASPLRDPEPNSVCNLARALRNVVPLHLSSLDTYPTIRSDSSLNPLIPMGLGWCNPVQKSNCFLMFLFLPLQLKKHFIPSLVR